MQRTLLWLLPILLAGCQQAGLSPRETQTQNYATYIMSLYDVPGTPGLPPASISLPARIAVAQVGEIAPPEKVLLAMRNNPAIAQVEPVPGSFTDSGRDVTFDQLRAQVRRIERISRDLGMNYLFLFGGCIDYDTHSNPLSLLDLTIVGAFVVPSKNVNAHGRAAGALIDLSNERIVFVTSVEGEKERLAPTASSDGQEQRTLAALREELTDALAQKMLAECQAHPAMVSPVSHQVAGEGVIPPGVEWKPATR